MARKDLMKFSGQSMTSAPTIKILIFINSKQAPRVFCAVRVALAVEYFVRKMVLESQAMRPEGNCAVIVAAAIFPVAQKRGFAR